MKVGCSRTAKRMSTVGDGVAFAAVVEFAYHSRYGYLTSCPTNVGTGMRLSVMLHLPGLAFTKQIDKVFRALQKINLAVRGLHGETGALASNRRARLIEYALASRLVGPDDLVLLEHPPAG